MQVVYLEPIDRFSMQAVPSVVPVTQASLRDRVKKGKVFPYSFPSV